MQNKTILVIGATGKTGSRIAKSLEDKGISIRRGSRSAPVPFDWDKAETWGPALDGVSAAYVSYFPDIAVPWCCGASRGVHQNGEGRRCRKTGAFDRARRTSCRAR
jgi:hypothetical protein